MHAATTVMPGEEAPAVSPRQPADSARTHVWLALTAAISMPLLVLLGLSLWHTPYAISETVALLEDVQTKPLSAFVDPATAYFRPLFYVTLSGIWRGAGSLGSALAAFKLLHLATVVLLVVLFVWQLRPRTPVDAAAATIALAVLVGHSGFRDNLENLPLNQMMIVMVLTLAVWSLLEREWRVWHGPVIVALMVSAIGFKEQGLLIAPLVVVAWWMGAPGVGRPTAPAIIGVTVLYLTLRVLGAHSWPSFPQDVGFGFTAFSSSDATERFGAFPLLIYAYNGGSTAVSILFSEPTAGVFRVVQHLSEGRVAPWEINHLISSCALTGLVVWWGLRSFKREADGRWSRESRLCMAAVLALGGSAALSFAYTRDRMGGVAVVFYALTSYCALRAVAQQATQLPRATLMAVSLALMLLGGAWQIRAIGTIEYARETASKTRREWITNLQRRRLQYADRPVYLRTMDAMIAQGTDPSAATPTDYPRWVVSMLRER